MLGASGWQTFARVTLPNIKWGLLYGVILCNARAMGEFGAVSVVSGHIRGQTNTIPLHVEILYNDYDFTGAFAVASLLTFLALITLGLKTWAERRNADLNFARSKPHERRGPQRHEALRLVHGARQRQSQGRVGRTGRAAWPPRARARPRCCA